MLAALADAHPYVRLAAIDALATPCPAGPDPVARLSALADKIPNDEGGTGVSWHEPAHAMTALAAVAPAEAASRLVRFVQHPVWNLRAYAARAAAVLRDTAALERLARDEDDNVRYEAVVGLRQVAGHAADTIFIEALARRDYQLVLTAAQALEGSPNRETAAAALLRAFARLTLERRETSRDPRMAILARLRELGSPASASDLNACLTDFDPVVAAECAAIVQAWTGVPQTPRPRPLRPQALDDRLPARARFVMRGDRTFDVMFFPDDTPATVSRIAQLIRRGYYNGTTFHRVVPNFVVQGGSPDANEYSGDGPFMRDELGLRANVRGTLGLSTRGRDTGDAQFFINLVDNPRLDHEYTVFGEITGGMDVVDAILEGDVIERIELR
jgi:cyclophilin family peptidyl-prolyl cis-trans isomerase